MARSKRDVVATVPGAATVTGAPDADAARRPTDQAEDTFAELEDEGHRPTEARIQRLDPATRMYGLLDTVDANVVDEAWLREQYGGGTYRVYYWGPMTDGSWGYLKGRGKQYRIDTSIPFKGALRDRLPLTGPVRTLGERPTATESDDDADMKMLFKSQLLNLVKEQNESRSTTMTLMMNMMNQQATASQQFMQMMVSLMNTKQSAGGGLGEIKELLGPLLQGFMNKKDPVEIATALMASMRQEGGGAGGGGGLSSLREFLEIKQLLGEATGEAGGGGEDKWIDLISKVVPGALDLLKTESARTGQPISAIARTANPTRPMATAPSSPALAGAPPVVPTVGLSPSSAGEVTTVTESHVPDEWTPLEPYIAQLVGMAAQNRDPYGVMQTVKTFAPQPMLGAIRELVARDDAVPMILQRFPALQPHQAWTALFIEEFRLEFFGEGDDDEPADAAPAGEAPTVEGA